MLLNVAAGTELLGAALSQNLMMAIILSMLLTPLVIAFGPHLAGGAARIPWLNRLLRAEPPGIEADEPHSDHVIVAGYGLAGREVCRAVRAAGFDYLAIDTNPDNVRAARAIGDRAVLGDVTQREVLDELGCKDARLVVLTVNDARATELAVRRIRATAPDVAIIARAPYELDRASLHHAGATEIVTAEATASASIVSRSLAALGSGALNRLIPRRDRPAHILVYASGMLTIESTDTIYRDGRHNAFTSMVRWRDRYYVAFRSADTHAATWEDGWDDAPATYGKIMLLESADLRTWTSSVILDSQYDDRDPKLLATDERLYVFSTTIIGPARLTMPQETYLSFTEDGQTWCHPVSAYRYNYGY